MKKSIIAVAAASAALIAIGPPASAEAKSVKSTAKVYVQTDALPSGNTVCAGLTVVLTGAPANTAWSLYLDGVGRTADTVSYEMGSTDADGTGSSPEFNVFDEGAVWLPDGTYKATAVVGGSTVKSSNITIDCSGL
jgi:hypothetical protein